MHFQHGLFLILINLTFFQIANCVRCYQCSYVRCPLNKICKEEKDICSVNNFERHLVSQVECPYGCSIHGLADQAGDIISWSRGCSDNFAKSSSSRSNLCEQSYFAGIRRDVCYCYGHLCNHSQPLLNINPLRSIIFSTLFSILIYCI